MVRIAVTGGIACGKSLVGKFLSDVGIPVCEADELAREQMKPGTKVFFEVVNIFGKGVLAVDGGVDRRVLGKRVFANPTELAALNAAVHPSVKRSWERWFSKRREDSAAAAVIVPLLYEIGEGGGWDAVICVTSLPDLQVQRLKNRGLSRADACQRMEAQMDTQSKAEQADFVLVNNGTRLALKEQSARVVQHIVEK